ncbi:MAG: hypothetical protein KBG15_15175 [Kofleriaceae bacterium]|nr:hypothetical protein [Kofleriaceae bacterium]
MAKIRFVDDWLRSPHAAPSRFRVAMVVAEKWAEQRVLMRAYTAGRDQTQPTITLHGQELAIGPATLDPNGPWGIHVAPLVDGRAQELQAMLEAAAKRLAGSKGNPPRLADEEGTFDREPTGNWDLGAPRMVPGAGRSREMEPMQGARIVASVKTFHANPPHHTAVAPTVAPSAMPVSALRSGPASAVSQPNGGAPLAGGVRSTPMPRRRPANTEPPGHSRTALGFQSGAGAQSALVRLGLSPAVSSRLARLAHSVVPTDFQITSFERMVLNMLGDAALYANADVQACEIGNLIAVEDPVAWMEGLIHKLEQFGLPLIEPGNPIGAEPSYRIRW